MVLPHQVVEPESGPVGVEDGAVARLLVLEGDRVGLVLVELRHLQRVELLDQRVHLRAPLRVEVVPVRVVVPRALLEEPGALGDLRRVGDGVAGDVDVAVDAAPVDAHRRRHREDPVLPRAERLVGGVDADRVERGHRHREVHRVPEPEALLVGLAPLLVEAGVVRVHLLPALAAGRSLDLVRAGKGSNVRRCCHLISLSEPHALGRERAATTQPFFMVGRPLPSPTGYRPKRDRRTERRAETNYTRAGGRPRGSGRPAPPRDTPAFSLR